MRLFTSSLLLLCLAGCSVRDGPSSTMDYRDQQSPPQQSWRSSPAVVVVPAAEPPAVSPISYTGFPTQGLSDWTEQVRFRGLVASDPRNGWDGFGSSDSWNSSGSALTVPRLGWHNGESALASTTPSGVTVPPSGSDRFGSFVTDSFGNRYYGANRNVIIGPNANVGSIRADSSSRAAIGAVIIR